MKLLAPPSASDPVEKLADWLEVQALIAADGNSSIQDLIQVLRRSGTTEAQSRDDPTDDYGGEASQLEADAAMKEIGLRSSRCGAQYPFEVGETSITVRDGFETCVYVYLLLLTVRKYDSSQLAQDGTSLFEHISAEAALRYLCPEGTTAKKFVFGTGADEDSSGFESQIKILAEALGEGGGPSEHVEGSHKKDGKLDIVAWKPFPDKRAGQLIAFGQCATGKNWNEKIREIQPREWAQLWFRQPLAVPPFAKMFFVPRCIEPRSWYETVVYSGLVFDRCRLAHFNSALGSTDKNKVQTWIETVLAE